MALKIIIPPEEEPLTLGEAKAHLRVDMDDDDDLILSLIVAARQFCEDKTHRKFITQTWEKYADDWPQLISPYEPGAFDFSLDNILSYPASLSRKQYIELLPGVSEVSAFTYKTADGTINTLDPSCYEVDSVSTIGRVILVPNQTWPASQPWSANGICIRFTCGYGSAADVPQTVKQAMLMLISLWYDHRAASEDVRNLVQVPFAVDALLSAETVLIV